ncbi:hypothetical protein [Pectobacterium polaris]|uniref:hypothetical protein n=1 Tax=Pectobacterium polaris TaxID=2042057 RepID=UPI000F8F7B8B|nr:hypothetical protein [Pectobacterium polaris]RUR99419.1 hypothetical protein KHDHEBDM_01701 [Pectobacterium polaris]
MTTIHQPAGPTAGAAIASGVRKELLSRKKVGKAGLPFHVIREDQIKTRRSADPRLFSADTERRGAMNQTQSIEVIAEIVGKKLDIAGDETRRLAITGAFSGMAQAFYSRQQPPAEMHMAGDHDTCSAS